VNDEKLIPFYQDIGFSLNPDQKAELYQPDGRFKEGGRRRRGERAGQRGKCGRGMVCGGRKREGTGMGRGREQEWEEEGKRKREGRK
jgi:hypothetical protein